MQIHDMMSRQVQTIHRASSVCEAAERMKTLDVGMMPVYDGHGLVGTLTDRDIAVRAVAEKLDPANTPVGDVMSPGVTCCFEDQDHGEAARLMAEKRIRRLLVLDRERRLVGIVSLGDLATTPGAEEAAGAALETLSNPAN